MKAPGRRLLLALLALAGLVVAESAAAPGSAQAPGAVEVVLRAEMDAGFGSAAERTLIGRVLEKNPYELVLDANVDPESDWTAVMSFSGRDVVSIDGVPYAEFRGPGTDLDTTWVLARPRSADGTVTADEDDSRGELVLSGRAVTHLLGLEVIDAEGNSTSLAWLEVLGVDGLETAEWLRSRARIGLGTALLHPRTRVLDPRLHGLSRRVRFLWGKDAFSVLLALLVAATGTLAVAAACALGVARLTRADPLPTFQRVLVGCLCSCTVGLAVLALGSLLDGSQPAVEAMTILLSFAVAGAVYVRIGGAPLNREIPRWLAASGSGALVAVACCAWGLPALERWVAS